MGMRERGVDLNNLTWVQFREIFFTKYFAADVRSMLKREFMSLRRETCQLVNTLGSLTGAVILCP